MNTLETLDENKTNVLKQQFIDKMNQNPIFKNTLSEPNYREKSHY